MLKGYRFESGRLDTHHKVSLFNPPHCPPPYRSLQLLEGILRVACVLQQQPAQVEPGHHLPVWLERGGQQAVQAVDGLQGEALGTELGGQQTEEI